MSDSESEARSSSGFPDATAIEQRLRDTVANIFKSGNLDELTVKRVRLATEEKLGLEQGFFKSHNEWKLRSDEIIKNEVVCIFLAFSMLNVGREFILVFGSKSANAKGGWDIRKNRRIRYQSRPQHRKNDNRRNGLPQKPIRLRCLSKGARRLLRYSLRKSGQEDSEHSVSDKDEAFEPEPAPKTTKGADAEETSETEMSVVIDDEPKPKRKRSAGQSSAQSKGKKPTSEKKRKEPAAEDADQAEIKRLQGWLVKCGIRKVWGRELMGCNTPKEKINHLKSMLKDAGMDGRYSIEKATRIREERELKADLEAAQEGAKMWGANVDEAGPESPKAGRSSRRIAKSFKRFDFLGQEDQDSESD
ncbi:conserved hypothetical protein [Microsporum canis CBS 113480]|uniref:Transcriptional regulator n=1 Tax=Arthroderma otae (strain ATCC MYA-4605 / CBS 113480) TaxID=554155 RepID=C5FTS0_ARTOC|nr:conserved hypothetical protein [Microsporum canis CBS 113480]EEQ33273.1 conserved hypothetical protein [Microsporum canis CBS 113480]